MSGDDAWLTPPEAPVPPPAGQPAPRPEVPPADETVRVEPPRRLLTPPVVTTFFVVGIVLLIAGLVTVVRLTDKVYDRPSALTPAATTSKVPASPVPSSLLRNRLGPTRLAMGQSIIVTGDVDSKFQVTVKARTFHRSACDAYGVKPKLGGYLPVDVTIKVLQGEPDISPFAFKFQQPDGTWLDAVGGSGCDDNFGALVRRLVAGRTYRATLVFGTPNTKGEIVLAWPLTDVVAAWRVG